ncbi:MAG: thioesterase [Alphaproteobacteria bacterium]|jgi:uncharacterized protein (TIGR00369 family)|nr:thioesterase [Alphaproteobacteria bacterium]MDP7142653.1 PaaI family thioesterase [Alphaproteobacteria bacterium]HCQ71513.1 thioesterase [Rhodospirillaceae bacterium]|tara:strand:- start:3697 stop:4101 length:405 start_codon:yes stop_codon:yes gene_type:complete
MANKDDISHFIQTAFPHADITIESVEGNKARIRKPISTHDLRPGNTVSGPTLMAMADAALYVAIFATLGLEAQSVTTNLNISFLRRPPADADIIAECSLLKVGQQLITGEVTLWSDGASAPVAFAVGSYALFKE